MGDPEILGQRKRLLKPLEGRNLWEALTGERKGGRVEVREGERNS